MPAARAARFAISIFLVLALPLFPAVASAEQLSDSDPVEAATTAAQPPANPSCEQGEIESRRTRDSKLFRNEDCTFSALFGSHLHERTWWGWDDVDLTFHADGSEHVMERHDIEVRISGRVLMAMERESGKGIRWLLPTLPTVAGRTVSFRAGGLDWRYVTQTTGLKLSAKVAEPLGRRTWEFPYEIIGGASEFSVDEGGNLVSDVFSVPRPIIIGADGAQYETEAWRILSENRVAFSSDDSTLPPEAFPYVIDPTTTFSVTSSGDDGYVSRKGLTYPPLDVGSATTVDTSTASISAMRSKRDPCLPELTCPEYEVRNAFARWDTSSLPNNAVVSAATARLRVNGIGDNNSRSLTADWYNDWPIDAADYSEPARTDAISGVPLSTISSGLRDFSLADPDSHANVSRILYTGLRFHISGTQPTNENLLQFAANEHATHQEPQLLVTYSTPPTISSASDTPDPVTAGDPLTFNVSWSDSDAGDQVRAVICKTSQITSTATCPGGTWATGALSGASPSSVSFTPTAANHGSNSYSAYACDMANVCSTSWSGTFTVTNRTPSASSASDSPDPVEEGTPITFSVSWNDPGDSVRAVVCKTNAISGASCPGGTWAIGGPSSGGTSTASYSPIPSEVGPQTYFAFACDVAGACSSSILGTFTVQLGPTGGVRLQAPETLHSNGAELSWTPYADPVIPFDKIQVHRSTTANFNPSDATLLAEIRDPSLTAYTDTTATPGQTFHYRLVVNLASTATQTVTLPAAGKASKLLQPSGGAGQVTRITSVSGSTDCLNYGAEETTRVGSDGTETHRSLVSFDFRDIPAGAPITSATLELHHGSVPAAMTVDLHALNTPWIEGTGNAMCTADGATWLETEGGLGWATPGGDFDSIPVASVNETSGEAPGWDTFNVTSLVQSLANAEKPNLGMLLKARNEGGGGTLNYVSDDNNADPQRRPKLSIEYTDGSTSIAPLVTLLSPSPSAIVKGAAVSLAAAASDDRRVDKVEFLVDGVVVGSDTTSPFDITWSSLGSDGTRTFRARAIDDVGNTTTSDPVTGIVDNSPMPTVSITSPLPASIVSGEVVVNADASDQGGGISKVEFLMDGFPIGEDTAFPYSTTWATLDPNLPAYDGTHVLSAAAFDLNGQVTESQGVSVTVGNTALTKYRAQITATDAPSVMAHTPNASQQQTYAFNVTVTNTSGEPWSPAAIFLRHRWFSPEAPVIASEASPFVTTGANISLGGAPVLPTQSVILPVTIEAPALPAGVARSKYRLQFDLFDQSGNTFFAEKGNPPSENPVTVNNELMKSGLGLERYYHYRTQEVGAGMTHLVNVANGNSLLRWTPFASRGIGLSSVLDLTYNSLEASTDSPVGSNWSASLSSLVRMGTRLDIRPHGSQPAGKNFVEFIDGDGTSHRFEGVPDTGTAVFWKEPAGVHLYLRKLPPGDTSKTWALTRPDRVTFFFDNEGYPTSVEDKNGNRLAFTHETMSGSDDPGGGNLKKRITRVTDQGGDFFSIAYYAGGSRVPARVRGKVQTITDHSGSQMKFDYYNDGNLLRITQVGGTTPEGVNAPTRSFVFTYTTSNSSGPAIPNASNRVNPDPKTSNQGTQLFSVRDPRGKETTFAYITSGQSKLKLSSTTDRSAAVTSFAYDIDNRLTTVQSPDGEAIEREHRYGYDADGKLTSLRNPHMETTSFEWSADRHLTKVTEPTGAFTQFAYNDNGYLTDRWDQLGNRTTLEYQNIAVDSNDVAGKWKTGRTIPHISQLVKRTDPKGTATTAPTNDFQWEFSYNSVGDLTQVKDPTGAITSYVVNLNGTVASMRDPNGQPSGTPTIFESYDANGCPTSILDPAGGRTRMFCDKDGLVRWVQDPLHANSSGSAVRRYRTFFDFDIFHRLARQSTPKSTQLQSIIWTATEYDANDNVVTGVGPHEAQQYTGKGSRTTVVYDDMDRPTRVTGPDKSADPSGERTDLQYDKAGRLVRMALPRGVQTSGVADDFVTIYNYDKLDRVTSETRNEVTGAGSTRRTFYCYNDPAGDLKWLVSPRSNQPAGYNCAGAKPSHTTEYGYDVAHRPTSVKDPLFNAGDPTKHQEKFTYDPNGNVTEVTNANGDVETREYDQRNFVTKVTEPFAPGPHPVTTAFRYDGNGNLTELISPRAWDSSVDKVAFPKYATKYVYDRLDRLVRVDLPSTPSDTQQYVHNEYDPNGNLLRTSLPTTELNPALVPANRKTVMTYFDTGWVRTSNDPGPIPAVRFDYTPEGWQSLRVPQKPTGGDATSRRVFTTYFPDGMPKEVTDRAGLKHTYAYDANNNLVSANRLAKNGNNAVVITASYDGFDQVAEVLQKRKIQSGFTGTTFTYDPNGNVATREDDRPKPQGGSLGPGRLHSFTYDPADRVATQIDNHGTAGNASDDRRIETSFLPTGWEQQRIVQRANGSGGWNTKQTTNWAHFANGKLRTLTTKGPSGATIESHAISYTEGPLGQEVYVNGHRTVDEFTLQGPSGQTQCKSTPCRSTFTYDPRDRLVTHSDGQSGSDSTITDYQLDTIGNVISESRNGSLHRTFTYEVDRLKEEKDGLGNVLKKYVYDDWGNLKCITTGGGTDANCNVSNQGTASPNLIAAYTHDELNRLELFRGFSGGAETDRATYDYDPLDRVVTEIEGHPGTANDRTTNFSYLGLTSLVTVEDRVQAAQADKAYGYDAYGNRITMANTEGGTTEEFTYAYDTHGSVSAIVKQTDGAVRATYGYGPYGAPDPDLTKEDDVDDDPLNPYRYSAKRLDSGSGSYDMGARRFSADPGRFLEQDLFMGALSDLGLTLDPLTQNRYSLAGGNPVSFAEWDGHMPIGDGGGGSTPGSGSSSYSDTQAQAREQYYGSSANGQRARLDAISSGIVPLQAQPQRMVERFPARPGYGVVQGGFFIHEDDVAFGLLAGDDRSFSSSALPSDYRVFFLVDYEQGRALLRVNPSCNGDHTDCRDARELDEGNARLEVGAGGVASLELDVRSSMRALPGLGPDINAEVVLAPEPGTNRVRGIVARDDYPDLEIYQRVSGTTRTLLKDRSTSLGPLFGLTGIRTQVETFP